MPPPIREAIIKSGYRFKIVFTQPAWFEGGWIPERWDKLSGLARIGGIEFEWVACAMDRPERFGGWDLARRDQKPVRAFVPRRTVYFLKGKDIGGIEKALGLWNMGFSETPPGESFDYGRMGLGHVFVGAW
jgi:CRISPR-associated protein Cmr3